MLLAFFDYLEAKLDENGFFLAVTKKPGMRRNLRNIFHRMDSLLGKPGHPFLPCLNFGVQSSFWSRVGSL